MNKGKSNKFCITKLNRLKFSDKVFILPKYRMKHSKPINKIMSCGYSGYLLLEVAVSLSVIVTICLILFTLLSTSLNIETKIKDSIELHQQAIEVTKHIESLIQNSKGITGIVPFKESVSNEKFLNTKSIRIKFSDEEQEIYLNKNRSKVFVTSIKNGSSQPGGYEIGDYVDNIYVKQYNGDRSLCIKLTLSKNNTKYSTEFSVNVFNYE